MNFFATKKTILKMRKRRLHNNNNNNNSKNIPLKAKSIISDKSYSNDYDTKNILERLEKSIEKNNQMVDSEMKYAYERDGVNYFFDIAFFSKFYNNYDFKNEEKSFNYMISRSLVGCMKEYNTTLKNNLKIISQHILSINDKAQTASDYSDVVNIIVRTHRRKNGFLNCMKSISDQTHKNIRVLVSVDDEITKNYVDEFNTSTELKMEIFEFKKEKISYWFNDYINKMFKYINDGWVMIVDDDNRLLSKNCLKVLLDIGNNIKKDHPTVALIFGYFRNDKIVYRDASSVFFSANILEENPPKMEIKRGGDYNLHKDILKKVNHVERIVEAFVEVNYRDHITGGAKVFEE